MAGRFDYQIGGAYPPVLAARIVDRDRSAAPVQGRYNICYVNAFQAQPGEVAWWRQAHGELLLRDGSGHEVIDTVWREPLLDTSTDARRVALARIVGGWIDGCRAAGFQAVELDNLDSYSRSSGRLTPDEAVAFAALLSARAHADHLAAAQKNAPELAAERARTGFDFAVAEECQVYGECDSYTAGYGPHVIEIEYTDNSGPAFSTACRDRGARISVLLRDRDVVSAGSKGYVSRWC